MALLPIARRYRLVAARRVLAAFGRHMGFARDHAARWRTRRSVHVRAVLAVLRSPPGAWSPTVINAPVHALTTRIYPRRSLNLSVVLRPRLSVAFLEQPASNGGPVAGNQSTQASERVWPPRFVVRAATPVVRYLEAPKPAERVTRSFQPVFRGPVSPSGGPATGAVHRVDRTRVHRIETVVHRVRIEPVRETKPAAPPARPSAQRPIQSGQVALGATAAVTAASAFSDIEVRRLTDRVVKDINRRIVGERERLGRL